MADTDTTTEARPSAEELWEVVRQIQDPELRMSIVDLGLVYHVDIDDEGLVTIDLTLTSPGCPVGPMIQGQAYHMLTQMDGVEDVEVNLVWDPPWDPKTMASEEVKMMLGIW
ncbi:MAG: metal-sulfur cluster assembly factor [Dehalococcoidia bacterium]